LQDSCLPPRNREQGEVHSLQEVLVTFFCDRAEQKKKTPKRSRITFWVTIAILVEALIVAFDGLGSNGMWVPGQKAFGIAMWNDCWLDFMDFFSEGLMMPLGAMLMALMIGWDAGPKCALDEIQSSSKARIAGLYKVCIKVIVPIVMAFILAGQIIDFIKNGTNNAAVTTAAYIISFALLIIFFIVAVVKKKKTAEQ